MAFKAPLPRVLFSPTPGRTLEVPRFLSALVTSERSGVGGKDRMLNFQVPVRLAYPRVPTSEHDARDPEDPAFSATPERISESPKVLILLAHPERFGGNQGKQGPRDFRKSRGVGTRG